MKSKNVLKRFILPHFVEVNISSAIQIVYVIKIFYPSVLYLIAGASSTTNTMEEMTDSELLLGTEEIEGNLTAGKLTLYNMSIMTIRDKPYIENLAIQRLNTHIFLWLGINYFIIII